MMALPRALPVAAGALALLATTTIVVIHIVLAAHITQVSSVGTSSILSSVLESVFLMVLGWMMATTLVPRMRNSKRVVSAMFCVSVLTCSMATAASVATMICLSNATKGLSDSLLGANQTSFLIASSVALGLCFACQLIFVVIHFVLARVSAQDDADSSYQSDEESRRSSPNIHIKSIPYSRTAPTYVSRSRSTSVASQTPPQSSSGRSTAETLSSIRSSLSYVVRPISSRTRLLPLKEKRRTPSIDSNHYRNHSDSTHEDSSFDSWDTSSVDMQSRMTVLGTSSPVPSRFLETIPASPTTSRSPSPGAPLELEANLVPPRPRRSRSYSPVGSLRRPGPTFTMQPTTSEHSLRRPEPAFTMQSSASESHIHPLFRSDSPDPPPMVTPGTVVTAAPDAVRVISDRHSVRRMRSGSLPSGPSPLSRSSSVDNFFPNSVPVKEEKEELEIPQEEDEDPTERQMTPPIPEWILTAGTRTSLSGYHSRKVRIEDGKIQSVPS